MSINFQDIVSIIPFIIVLLGADSVGKVIRSAEIDPLRASVGSLGIIGLVGRLTEQFKIAIGKSICYKLNISGPIDITEQLATLPNNCDDEIFVRTWHQGWSATGHMRMYANDGACPKNMNAAITTNIVRTTQNVMWRRLSNPNLKTIIRLLLLLLLPYVLDALITSMCMYLLFPPSEITRRMFSPICIILGGSLQWVGRIPISEMFKEEENYYGVSSADLSTVCVVLYRNRRNGNLRRPAIWFGSAAMRSCSATIHDIRRRILIALGTTLSAIGYAFVIVVFATNTTSSITLIWLIIQISLTVMRLVVWLVAPSKTIVDWLYNVYDERSPETMEKFMAEGVPKSHRYLKSIGCSANYIDGEPKYFLARSYNWEEVPNECTLIGGPGLPSAPDRLGEVYLDWGAVIFASWEMLKYIVPLSDFYFSNGDIAIWKGENNEVYCTKVHPCETFKNFILLGVDKNGKWQQIHLISRNQNNCLLWACHSYGLMTTYPTKCINGNDFNTTNNFNLTHLEEYHAKMYEAFTVEGLLYSAIPHNLAKYVIALHKKVGHKITRRIVTLVWSCSTWQFRQFGPIEYQIWSITHELPTQKDKEEYQGLNDLFEWLTKRYSEQEKADSPIRGVVSVRKWPPDFPKNRSEIW